MSIVSRILLILLLILINAFFSGSEAALVAANEIKVKHDANNGNKKAALTVKYINDSTNFLSTIQVGITFIGFVNGFLAAEAFTAPILTLFGPQYVESSLWQGVVKIVITLILTYMQVVFGELVPKKIAIQNPEKFIYRSVKSLSILNKIMNPLVKLLTVSANGVARLFGIKNQKEEMTEDEVRMLVIGSGDALKESEKEMFEKVLDFDDHLVNEVMTHRTEIVALNLAMDSKEIMKIIRNEQYSRIPVYEESIDNIIGILHVKDLLFFDKASIVNLKKIVRKPMFIPESMKTSVLFKEMQRTKNHMAIVVDEFGGTSGLVTIEDLLEEIVGNIFDEYDEVKEEVISIGDDSYIIDGLANIDDVEDIIHVGLPVEDYDTVSGFVLGYLERFPEENEIIEFEYNGYIYNVLEYKDGVIGNIKVSKVLEDIVEEDSNVDE